MSKRVSQRKRYQIPAAASSNPKINKKKNPRAGRGGSQQNNNNSGDISAVNEDRTLEKFSESFVLTYEPIEKRATVLRMYHISRPLFRRKNLLSGYLRCDPNAKPNRTRNKDFSLKNFSSKFLWNDLKSRQLRMVHLEGIKILIPYLDKCRLQIVVSCYHVTDRKVGDSWVKVFKKLKTYSSTKNSFNVSFGPILLDSMAAQHTPFFITTNYCVVFHAIAVPENDARLRRFELTMCDTVTLPVDQPFAAEIFAPKEVREMSERQMFDFYSEYLDLIENEKLLTSANYEISVFKYGTDTCVMASFELKGGPPKDLQPPEVIANNEEEMGFDDTRMDRDEPKRQQRPRHFYHAMPDRHKQTAAALSTLNTVLPIEYHFRYSVQTGLIDVLTARVKIESRQNYVCPICVTNCQTLHPLLLHLANCHLELEFSWEQQGGHVQINVSPAVEHRFGAPLTRSDKIVEHRFQASVVPPYQLLPKNLQVKYHERARKVATRRVALSSDKRAVKFRSQTLEPISVHQLDYDSEDEQNIDNTWLKVANEKRISEFADLGEEKKFLILWNNYIVDHPVESDSTLNVTCKRFATDCRREIQQFNLRDQFSWYLMHMWELKLLSPNEVLDCLHNVDQPI